MTIESFNKELEFDENRIRTKVVLETFFSKEIRILLSKGQMMKEHKAPFPIIIHIIKGEIRLGVKGVSHTMKEGDIITLEGDVPHDLTANENSVVRLSLSKLDKAERVKDVVGK
jgi:quercetin dioxygenase-like cupin family protein